MEVRSLPVKRKIIVFRFSTLIDYRQGNMFSPKISMLFKILKLSIEQIYFFKNPLNKIQKKIKNKEGSFLNNGKVINIFIEKIPSKIMMQVLQF